MQFSTFDVDNEFNYNCATDSGGNGGNWYYTCLQQNLNGVYGADGLVGGVFWRDFYYNDWIELKSMRWMVREVV